MIRRPPRSTLDRSSAASDVYKRQAVTFTNDIQPIITENCTNRGCHHGGEQVSLLTYDDVIKNGYVVEGNPKDNVLYQAIDSKHTCLLYTSPSPRDRTRSRMPSSA